MTGASVAEVADGVFSCEQPDGPRIIRQLVIAGSRAALVVDTGLRGSPAAGILPLLARLGLAPVILLTHPDADHVAGTAEVLAVHPGARVVAGAADGPMLGDPERAIRDRYARFARHDDVPFDEAMAERARARFGAPFARPDVAAADERIDLGDRVVELVATPGHSPGHTAVWLPATGVLGAADAAMGWAISDRSGARYIPPMYGPPAAYLTTVARLAALDPQVILTGHEPVLDAAAGRAFLADSAEACGRLADLTAAALGDGPGTLLALCSRVHAAYGGLPADRVRDLALTVDGHLADLVAAGAAEVEPGPPRRFRSVP